MQLKELIKLLNKRERNTRYKHGQWSWGTSCRVLSLQSNDSGETAIPPPICPSNSEGASRDRGKGKAVWSVGGVSPPLRTTLIGHHRDPNTPFTRVCKIVFTVIATEPTEKRPEKRIKNKSLCLLFFFFPPAFLFSKPILSTEPAVLQTKRSVLSKTPPRSAFLLLLGNAPSRTSVKCHSVCWGTVRKEMYKTYRAVRNSCGRASGVSNREWKGA